MSLATEYVHPNHAELGPECTPRKVLMSPELMVQLAEAASGRRVTVSWGQPDADGFYTPTVTVQDSPAYSTGGIG